MIGHVGTKVSALVDGQLPPAETERLWAHVHRCATCRGQVEREGWVKRQLAGLAFAPTPYDGRGVLSPLAPAAPALAGSPLGLDHRQRRRMAAGVAVGAGSIGAAMVGVLALSVPAEAPAPDRRTPTVSLNQTTFSPATQVNGRMTP